MVPWSDDPATLVANSLSPAQVVNVNIDEESRVATVTVPERMLSLAIGREGQNARLAAKLTGWRIDIRSDQAPATASVAPAAKTAAAIAGDGAGEPDFSEPTERSEPAAAEVAAETGDAREATGELPEPSAEPVAAEAEPSAEREPVAAGAAARPKRRSAAKKTEAGAETS